MSDGLWINGKFVLTSTIEKMMQLHKAQDKEVKQLRTENAELNTLLQERDTECYALKAMVNELRSMLITTVAHWDNDDDPTELHAYTTELILLLEKTHSPIPPRPLCKMHKE